MAQTSCLYRRPSGIYSFVSSSRNGCAQQSARTKFMRPPDSGIGKPLNSSPIEFSCIGVGIFMTLDIEKLRAENPLLDGDGMILIVDGCRGHRYAAGIAGE
ncbi:hypothetical protein [Burkholderia metallica]|uniref:hypothetical protein n=1 Tax=Burkholderia metallica TaxID=488729 RepID=UPI0015767A60|nr:hypothetical protein [Burkholderia metallica]